MPRHRLYTTAEVCDALNMPRRTFNRLKQHRQLPFLEEIKPRVGKIARYRADLVDRYCANEWNGARSFGK